MSSIELILFELRGFRVFSILCAAVSLFLKGLNWIQFGYIWIESGVLWDVSFVECFTARTTTMKSLEIRVFNFNRHVYNCLYLHAKSSKCRMALLFLGV